MAPGRTDCFLASIVAGMSLARKTQYILDSPPNPIRVANTRLWDSLQGGSLPVFNEAITDLINDLYKSEAGVVITLLKGNKHITGRGPPCGGDWIPGWRIDPK